jgi:tetratricopeptide (TPR) repeat protein
LDAAAGQIRLFAALVDVVRRAGAHRPVVLLLDDVHLADASTLSWVAFAVRRMAHLLVVTTRRSDRPRAGSAAIELGGSTIELAPLDLAAVAELVGAERAETLHRRSGGNPLFLLELANSPAGELPPTIVDAVRRRIDALGNAGATIRTAAVLGADVDVDVLAACTDRPLGEVLDELEEAARVRLLVDRGEGFVFAHELVREAIAADVTAARRAMVHREAARALGRRAEGRPLDTAFHARLGGAGAAAAAALIDAARLAADRFDVEAAEQLLDQAIELDDSPPARFARARVRMARSDHAGAAIDVSYAIGPDATADVFELAGWIAYYRRDHVLALRYADEAVHRADSGEVRASALALAGRIRHSRGQLQEAATRLEEAVALAPAGGSGLADFWLASLRVHQGRLAEATAPVWVDDEPRSHPFAVLHAWFARGLAHGLAGRLDAAAEALTGLERAMNGLGLQGRRFAPVSMNMAAWLLRATGREQEADERNAAALELSNGTAFEEPRGHALLDLAEGRRRAGELAAAAARVDEAAAALTADGTMAWHVRQRVLWMRGRIALQSGEFDRAADLAAELIGDADERGSPRYAVLGRHLAALAEPSALTSPAVDALVPRIDEHAGIDAWWLVPELIAAAGGDGTSAGQARAESLVASTAADVDREAMGRWLDQRLLRVASGRGVSRSSR